MVAKYERVDDGTIEVYAQQVLDDDGQEVVDICEIVVVSRDRDYLLDAITRSITTLGGIILDADVITTNNGIAHDRFTVRGDFVDSERMQELRIRIEKALTIASSGPLEDGAYLSTASDRNSRRSVVASSSASNATGGLNLPSPDFTEELRVNK